METLQTAIASLEDIGQFKKPLEYKKEHYNSDDHNETNYVDLGNPVDMKSDSTKTVKVTFTGEGNQLAIFKCKGDTPISGIKSLGEREDNEDVDNSSSNDSCADSIGIEKCYSERLYGERGHLKLNVPSEDDFTGDEDAETDAKSDNLKYETEELQYTDMYLNSRCESKDGKSAADAESHYITTHEIQLTEQDHDVDYEFGRGSCWDFEDDNLVYSFVDYASFGSDETTPRRIQSKSKSNKVQHTLRATGALVSTESELCESDKCASSDEGASKIQPDRRNSAGHIHLSIKTSSRAINDHATVLEEKNVRFHTKHAGERGHYSFRSSDSKSETLYDRYFIPPPGRQHLASKLRGKDINEYSSGASSSVSELDDADKEVRNLTARSFRSLACPYFDAINLSSSSESSMSEQELSINKWSAFVDLNYSNLTQGREQNMLAHKNSTPILEGNKCAECKNVIDLVPTIEQKPQTNILSLKNTLNSQQASSGSSKKIETSSNPGVSETITLTETLNFSCNVGAGIPARERRAKRAQNAARSRSTADVTGTVPSRLGCEEEIQLRETAETLEDTHKKSIFASSLLKNVISKKMQLEQERKMERGEISNTYPTSPLDQSKDQDAKKEKEIVQRQTPETSDDPRAATDNISRVLDDQPQENPCSLGAEHTESRCEPDDALKTPLPPSEKSAFKTWKDGEEESKTQGDGESKCAQENTPPNTSFTPVMKSSECVEGESSKMIQMSHLYVPSSQFMPKEKEAAGISLHNLKASGEFAESDWGGRGQLSSGQLLCSADIDKTSRCQKAPEIKICLRSVRENKSNQLNIANHLTPIIRVSPKKATNESKSHLLTVSDKVPHFMVRDIRDSKCKFQTPIHQVRDVRKLVKSSYRFVALENTCPTSGTVSTTTELREEGKPVQRGPFPSPMVIKCQSVNTKSVTKPHEPVNPRESESVTSECTFKSDRCRVPCAKQPLTEQPEFSLKIDAKTAKQKMEKGADAGEKKPESKVSNQIALEKLKAAVKTMEQLYVFDRNEWKRKTQAPRPITDSHVLSLITREEQGVTTKTDIDNEYGKACNEKLTSSATASNAGVVIDEGELCMPAGSHSQEDASKLVAQRADSFNNKCVFSMGRYPKAPTHVSTVNESAQQMFSSSDYSFKSHKVPLSLKLCPAKLKSVDGGKGRSTVSEHQQPPYSDSDNYLTIPVKTQASDSKLAIHPKPSLQPLQCSPIVMEPWSTESKTATIYHHAVPLSGMPAVPAAQPQVLCLTPPAEPPVPHIQRKLLLDPTTGQYYLVDTHVPMQPAAQRFYHLESGQYLDIPKSVVPVPMSVSPVTLSPAAACSPTYLVYPSTLLPPHTHPNPQSHSSTCSEGKDTVETGSYLMPPGPLVPSSTKPIISITSQPGAHIVAPPSFDGTTMSFVVEHR
ncbi:uncharacterized protein C4orf54-like [Xyrauchen texanus]|uniref:uncharacterized protein C4orf54-like n=1 Tax=Xyrauchen texanus TaxID=154827 RepID=UPI0022423248|nr:uncharacterized protein C4orf54-like [Xyrauchen texanus]